jgi:hypothetical protein
MASCAAQDDAKQPRPDREQNHDLRGTEAPTPRLLAPTPERMIEDEASNTSASAWIEAFPFVRVDREHHAVEFDAAVTIDVTDPDTPDVYLEVLVCTPDSKEHESLLVTRARPSHVHAAMLLAGFEPGAPGRVEVRRSASGVEVDRAQPTGDAVRVVFIMHDGENGERMIDPLSWVRDARDGGTLDRPIAEGQGEEQPAPAFVFAGSRIVQWQGREFYDADGTGTLIGLTTFGSEVVALSRVVSPESAIDEPELLAANERVPAFGTPVVVRITAAG